MDRLSEMEAFICVVDQGGFTDAARKLGISKSAVSKHVAALEGRLGARLLDRTTRRVNPTEIGLAYYDRAASVVNSAVEADDMVSVMQSTPRGALRVSVPVSFGTAQLSGLIGPFLSKYPEVTLNLVLDDRFVELVSEGFDVAIRIGQLPDSSLIARKLAETRCLIAVAPDYVKKHGMPTRVEDFSEHQLLHYSNLSTGNFWRFKDRHQQERHIRVGGRLTANNGDMLLQAAIDGIGIALIPEFMIGDAFETGKLVEVLPNLQLEKLGIFVVYPPGRYVQPKLRAFIDFLVEELRNSKTRG